MELNQKASQINPHRSYLPFEFGQLDDSRDVSELNFDSVLVDHATAECSVDIGKTAGNDKQIFRNYSGSVRLECDFGRIILISVFLSCAESKPVHQVSLIVDYLQRIQLDYFSIDFDCVLNALNVFVGDSVSAVEREASSVLKIS